FRECQPCTGSNLCTYNAMTTIKIYIRTKKVHAAPFAFGITCRLSIEFFHTTVNRNALGYCQSMIPVSSNEQVFGFSGCDPTCGNGFLAYIGMKKSTDLAFHFILFFRHQFEMAD